MWYVTHIVFLCLSWFYMLVQFLFFVSAFLFASWHLFFSLDMCFSFRHVLFRLDICFFVSTFVCVSRRVFLYRFFMFALSRHLLFRLDIVCIVSTCVCFVSTLCFFRLGGFWWIFFEPVWFRGDFFGWLVLRGDFLRAGGCTEPLYTLIACSVYISKLN